MKADAMSNQEESKQLIPFVTHQEANADILIYEGAMKYKTGFEAFQAPDAEGSGNH